MKKKEKDPQTVVRCKCCKYMGNKYKGILCDVCNHLVKRRSQLSTSQWIMVSIIEDIKWHRENT